MDVLMVYVINIDESKCKADGDCANICPARVLELQESSPKRTVVVDADACLGCMACVNTCTNQAITVTEY